MRKIASIICLCLLVMTSTGCKKAKLRVQLEEIMSSEIALPDRVTCVSRGEIFQMPDSLRNVPKLIVYVDSSECTTCRIAHISQYDQVFRISEEKGTFDVVLLLYNIDQSGIPLTRYLSDVEIGYPVYVDEENVFRSLNPVVPDDRRLHTFLIGTNGTPLCVGDPSTSGQMLDVFLRALDQL